MKPSRTDSQRSLFSFPLEKILDPDHPLVILSARIDWSQFDDLVDECYAEEGRPGCTTRLMIGLLYWGCNRPIKRTIVTEPEREP